ncbi:MAG: hypothetical protein IT438_04040 [Phycisphaerales bacterium]|nr:hypothetical protein [Phycisphaerales bacterium]
MPRLALPAAAALALLTAAAIPAAAQTSTNTITLQAKLDGIPAGPVNLTIQFYDALTVGNPIGAPITLNGVPVQNGIVSVPVTVDPTVFNGSTRYMGISVNAGPELSPRTLVASVPYAMQIGPARVSEIDGRILRIGGAVSICDSPEASPVMPPDGQRTVGLWGTYIVARNDADRYLRLGVSNDGWSKAEIRLENSNEQWGRIQFLTNENSASPTTRMLINEDGRVGIGTLTPEERLDVNGTAQVRVLKITGGSDLAEPFPPSPTQPVTPQPGMVMSIDPSHPGHLRVAGEAYDTKVAGVYSGANGLPAGMVMGKESCMHTAPGADRLPIAMSGRVWVFAEESNGVIMPGDRLTTSAVKPGYAMRATDAARCDGAVIGKAMTPVDPATGMVLALVNLQ